MAFNLEREFSETGILRQINALKQQVDNVRPLPVDIDNKVMQKLRLEWNYNSNAIEGNRLSYGETRALLMHGITAKGKPLRDHLSIQGHNKSIEYIETWMKEGYSFDESNIKALHEVLLLKSSQTSLAFAAVEPMEEQVFAGQYKTAPNYVITVSGETHYYTTPEETPVKMTELITWYNEAIRDNAVHPAIVAILFHLKFISIHPFADGNGRLARMLMNLIMMQNGYPPVIIKIEQRRKYYTLLNRADTGDNWPFVEFILERLLASLQLYIKAINGVDINESEDIDKEIALLRLQLTEGAYLKEKKNTKTVKEVFLKELLPLGVKLKDRLSSFNEFFFHDFTYISFYAAKGDENYSENAPISYLDTKTYDQIFAKIEDISKLKMHFSFSEYRNPSNNFDVLLNFSVEFESYYYQIAVGNQILVAKPYHEKLSSEDETEVIKHLIESFKQIFSSNQGMMR